MDAAEKRVLELKVVYGKYAGMSDEERQLLSLWRDETRHAQEALIEVLRERAAEREERRRLWRVRK